MGPRYALYFVPRQASRLAQFGARAIGYDIWSGDEVPLADIEAYRQRGRDLTSEPRRYGFHATLKAPFHLRDGQPEHALEAHVSAFASARQAFALGAVEVRVMSRFVALVPVAPPAALLRLAADCVTEFDPYRAMMSEADRARRLEKGLTPRQLAHLEAWGYPHVFDEFRFHMTLTGPLEAEMASHLRAELAALWANFKDDVAIDGLTLAVQPARNQPFRVKAHFPFKPPAATRS